MNIDVPAFQIIQNVGTLNGAFQINFQGRTSTAISAIGSAQDVQAALLAMTNAH